MPTRVDRICCHTAAALHGSWLRADLLSRIPPLVDPRAFGHSQAGHCIEDPTTQPDLNTLPGQGSTPHLAAHYLFVSIDRVFNYAPFGAARPLVPCLPARSADRPACDHFDLKPYLLDLLEFSFEFIVGTTPLSALAPCGHEHSRTFHNPRRRSAPVPNPR